MWNIFVIYVKFLEILNLYMYLNWIIIFDICKKVMDEIVMKIMFLVCIKF